MAESIGTGIPEGITTVNYNDAWFLYKKYLNGDGSDEYWECLNNEANRIIEKHNKDPFARSLVMAVIDEIERSRKQ